MLTFKSSLLNLTLFLSLLSLCSFTLSCAPTHPDNEVWIGAYLPLTGPNSDMGLNAERGIRLAIEQANLSGGIKDKKIKVIIEDDRSTSIEASSRLTKLISRDHVLAIIGELTSQLSALGGIYADRNQVPVISPSATRADLTENRTYLFRSCFSDDLQGETAAVYAYSTLKKKKVAILFNKMDQYSSGLAKTFKEKFEQLGGTIIAEKDYHTGETSFTTYLEMLKGEELPELVYAPVTYKDMAQIARQAYDVGFTGKDFLGGDGWGDPELLKDAGKELEGAHLTDHFALDSPRPAIREFEKIFRKAYNAAPNSLNVQAYDATMILLDAIKRAKDLTGPSVQQALSETKDFEAVTGSITVDKNHNVKKPVVIVKVSDQAFKFESEVNPEVNSDVKTETGPENKP